MKRIAAAIALVVAAVALVFVVLVGRGRDAMQKSDEALAKGDFASAIVFAERAAEARLFFSPYPDQGYARLSSIADERSAAGDAPNARAALRAIIVAAQTTGAPDARVREARDRLAKLDPNGTAANGEGTELAPPFATRVALAFGVVFVALGLAVVEKRARVGWALLALGIVGILAAALA